MSEQMPVGLVKKRRILDEGTAAERVTFVVLDGKKVLAACARESDADQFLTEANEEYPRRPEVE